jgi:glycosyltransferase involved in cell wall biosynthesis
MDSPVVSILIPAYNERFFPQAFASACRQTLANIEVVVSDDSPGDVIRQLVEEQNDPRVRYFRNVPRLGFHGNFTRCFDLAAAPFIKFLNDDDVLAPNCVESLHALFMQFGDGVSLATSRRQIIDEAGNPLDDSAANPLLSWIPCRMDGRALGDFVLANSSNFIGEPTTVMFRKSAIAPESEGLFSFAGNNYHCLADLSLWLRLLAVGDAAYMPDRLSAFRVHPGQEQYRNNVWQSCWTERVELVFAARELGFLRRPQAWEAACAAAKRRVLAVIEALPEGAAERAELERSLRKFG